MILIAVMTIRYNNDVEDVDDVDNDDHDGNNNGCVLSYTEYSLHNIHREMEVRRGIDPTALKVIFNFNFCSLNFNDWIPHSS